MKSILQCITQNEIVELRTVYNCNKIGTISSSYALTIQSDKFYPVDRVIL